MCSFPLWMPVSYHNTSAVTLSQPAFKIYMSLYQYAYKELWKPPPGTAIPTTLSSFRSKFDLCYTKRSILNQAMSDSWKSLLVNLLSGDWKGRKYFFLRISEAFHFRLLELHHRAWGSVTFLRHEYYASINHSIVTLCATEPQVAQKTASSL